MSTITINGTNFSGDNIVVVNGKIIVDGTEVPTDVIDEYLESNQ